MRLKNIRIVTTAITLVGFLGVLGAVYLDLVQERHRLALAAAVTGVVVMLIGGMSRRAVSRRGQRGEDDFDETGGDEAIVPESRSLRK
jgi:hypothetical protein